MRLFLLIFLLVSTGLAGAGITAVLASGLDGTMPIIAAAALGAVIGVPVAWLITKRIASLG
ncbi:hypothetical protein V8J82_11880 [Gymnodinialimonas sp. 2305UL16-5]|uniref:hypothetical protein n=1 Tax=Gymnodinialimonas mytili TaxID=3126503 RepID=UPI0030B44B5B